MQSRKRAIAAGSLLAVIAMAGCKTRLLDEPIAMEPPADLAMKRPDGGRACVTHELLPVAMADLRQLNPGQVDPGQQQYGTVIRMLAVVPVAPCEAIGDVLVRVMPGNATDFIVLTVRVWKSQSDCGAPVLQKRVIEVPQAQLGNARWVVGDGAPGGTKSLSFPVWQQAMASCQVVLHRGDRCQKDCQCEGGNAGLVCILEGQTGGQCEYSCTRDNDCPRTFGCDTVSDFTCVPGGGAGCSDCPAGWRCDDKSCRPPLAITTPPCKCDRDCPDASLCTIDGNCVVPCSSVADCPLALGGSSAMVFCTEGRCSNTR